LSQSKKHRGLAFGYSAEVDTVDEASWSELVSLFDDANIYQTWTYDEIRAGRGNISQLVLKKGNEVVAIAQARIMKLPVVKAGISYVRWGPLWRRGDDADPEIFRQTIRALRNEYACRRGLVLRLYPILFDGDRSGVKSILHEEGFCSEGMENPDRTLLLDLNPPLDDLRKGMRQHWRRYLKVAEKNAENSTEINEEDRLEIIQGTDDKLFEMFISMYRELLDRKAFAEPNDINEFRQMQQRLPEKFKMKVVLCKSAGELCAGVVCSAIGKTGIYLYGATSNAGLKKRGSYLIHWRMIEWLKNNGFTTYDLHGINPVTNPGTYKFKSDLCGDNNGRDVHFVGRFDTHTSVLSSSFVSSGDKLRAMMRSLKKRRAKS
jgi:lipid II:glycine glycyltransferase (peptidoglycan interpeptide bridge formation enzyme)